MSSSLTRRNILRSAGATTLCLASKQKIWAADPMVRPDIASSAGRNMVNLYAMAVKAMQDPAINYPPQPQS